MLSRIEARAFFQFVKKFTRLREPYWPKSEIKKNEPSCEEHRGRCFAAFFWQRKTTDPSSSQGNSATDCGHTALPVTIFKTYSKE
jgi:hypothetical protein